MGVKCLKYSLFVTNFIYMVSGIVCLAAGIILKKDNDMRDRGVPNVFIVIGVVTIAIALIGFCGAYRKSVCLSYLFGFLLVIIIIIELVVGIGCTTDDIDKVINDSWNDQANDRAFWDKFEKENECCGLKSATDYEGSIPDSCCKTPPCTKANAFSDGCQGDFEKNYKQLMKDVGVGLIAHAVFTLIELIFALSLGHRIRKQEKPTAAR